MLIRDGSMKNFTIIIPYYNGEKTIDKLIQTLPKDRQIIVVDDHSQTAPKLNYPNVTVIKDRKKGYFTGAVNFGISKTSGDVLILNQDVYFVNDSWLTQLENALEKGFSYIGERIRGTRKDWPHAYIHGTYMYITREVIDSVGLMNSNVFPMWGSTAEYQLRVARAGFKILPLLNVEGFVHIRPSGEAFGNSFKQLLQQEKERKKEFVLTPPLVSVVIPVHGEKYAQFLQSTVNSLIGGHTDLGEWKQQTFGAFEVVIVEDSSYDNTPEIVDSVCDSWKGVRAIHLKRPKDEVISTVNGKYIGKVVALNTGIESAYGTYISVLDADDMMEEDRLERLYTAAVENPHSLIYDDMYTVTDGKRTRKWTMENYDFEKLIYKNQIHNAIFFEKSAWKEIGGYPERFKYGREDWAINVKLGINGYCGVHLDYAGLLYRRDGQNRTIENTKPDWMRYFQSKMVKEYPDLYRGERPMSCCGRGSRATSALSRTDAFTKTTISKATDVLVEGTTLVIYAGTRIASFSVWGFKTNTQYRVTPGKPFAVSNLDLYSDNPKKYPGIMDRYNPDNTTFMFKLVPVEEKVVEVIKIEEPIDIIEPVKVLEEAATFVEPAVDFSILDGNITLFTIAMKENNYTESELRALLAYELANKNRIGVKTELETLLEQYNEFSV